MSAPVAAAGAVILRGDAVLLVRRGRPPLQGEWSLPGGKIRFGESASEAAVREAREETGCAIAIAGLIDVVDWIDEDAGAHFVLADFAARWIAGEPVAGDDADAARFFTPAALAGLALWSETRRVIEEARRLF